MDLTKLTKTELLKYVAQKERELEILVSSNSSNARKVVELESQVKKLVEDNKKLELQDKSFRKEYAEQQDKICKQQYDAPFQKAIQGEKIRTGQLQDILKFSSESLNSMQINLEHSIELFNYKIREIENTFKPKGVE